MAHCKLLQSRAPKHLWGHCLELVAYITSNTAHEIYKLDGEVSETLMSGKTSEISQFCELEWFKWTLICDETAPFPDNVLKLGHYLVPSIGKGSAMSPKIFTQNGQMLHRSTYRPLISDEIADKEGLDAQEQFMARVHEKLGSHPNQRVGHWARNHLTV